MKKSMKIFLICFCLVLIGGMIYLFANRKIIVAQSINQYIAESITRSEITNVKDEVGTEILGIKEKEFLETFGTETTGVDVEVSKGCVYIIPASDFLESQHYYFDSKGNLIKYEAVSNTVGGQVNYYFKDDKLIGIAKNEEEPNTLQTEDIPDIMLRAKNIYQRYLGGK